MVMTSRGYIKTVAADAFRSQGRGGRGVAGTRLKDEDYVTDIIGTSAHAFLLFFSNLGKVYRLKAHRIPMRERTAQGLAIVNLLRLQPEEHIQTIIDTRDYETHRYLLFVTRNGVVKKTMFNAYDNGRQDGLIAINLRDGDELVRVIPTSGHDDILLISSSGQGIRFSEEDVRPMGRNASGVRGMRLRPADAVVGADVALPDGHVLTITDAGYGKRTAVEQFNRQGRGGQGVRAHRVREGRGRVVTGFLADDDDDVLLVNDSGTIIRTVVGSISVQGRDATGVRVMNLDEDTRVAAVARVPAGPEESDEDAPEAGDPSGAGPDGGAGDADAADAGTD